MSCLHASSSVQAEGPYIDESVDRLIQNFGQIILILALFHVLAAEDTVFSSPTFHQGKVYLHTYTHTSPTTVFLSGCNLKFILTTDHTKFGMYARFGGGGGKI